MKFYDADTHDGYNINILHPVMLLNISVNKIKFHINTTSLMVDLTLSPPKHNKMMMNTQTQTLHTVTKSNHLTTQLINRDIMTQIHLYVDLITLQIIQ